jgi:exonuclease SbcC
VKLHSLKFRGIGRFREEVTLPIAELGEAALVAIVGENGAGKTTAVEMLPGLLYRSTPSRGALAALANAKDSYVEAVVETDQRYTLRVLIDGIAKNKPSEGYILASGAPLVSGKVRDYDAAIARLFPAADVLLSSAFAAQSGEGRFLDLPASARKQLFAKLLGLGHLERLAMAATTESHEAHHDLDVAKARREDLQRRADAGATMEAEVATRREAHAAAVAAREEAEAKVVSARAALDAHRAREAELSKAQGDAMAELRIASDRHMAARTKLDSLQDELAQASARRAALEGRLAVRAALETQAAAADALQRRVEDAETALRAAREEEEAHLAVFGEWRDRKAAAERRAQDLEVEWRSARDKAATLRDAQRKDVARIEAAASGLDKVPCHGEGEFAACALIAAATKARAALPGAKTVLAEYEARAASVEPPADLEEARRAVAEVGPEPRFDAAGTTPRLEHELRGLRTDLLNAVDARGKLAALDEVKRQADAIDVDAAKIRAAITTAAAQVEAIASEVKRIGEVTAAATIALNAHKAAAPKAVDERALAGMRATETAAAADVARAEQALADAQSAAAEVAEFDVEVARLTADLDDWQHLVKALGRDGIQALEIDAAGPEVSGLTNELLHACYGPRFSVSLETTALKADGKGTKEVFDLRVIDTERGVEGSADQLSGGEKVLVSEALALAIAIYNTRRSSIPLLTLFRDECAGALSTANATRYVEMLRRAVALGGFHRVFFIAHQPQLWAMADACLVFEDGKVRLSGTDDVDPGAVVANVNEEAA